MSLTAKGTKHIAKRLAAYAKAGESIAARAPFQAVEAFFDAPPTDSDTRAGWQTALTLIADKHVRVSVDDAHGHQLADLAEEAFMTGLYAGSRR